MSTHKKLGVSVIIQNQSGKYLLHLRDGNPINMPNQWSLIGGEVEEGERPENTAKREVEEETNLILQDLTIIKKIEFNEIWDTIIFHAYVNTNKSNVLLREGEKLSFLAEDEVKSLIENLPYSNPLLVALNTYIQTKNY